MLHTEPFALLFGEKGEQFCKKFLSFHQRMPHFLPKEMLKELGAFLTYFSEPFLENRPHLLLARIFFSLHRMRIKAQEQNIQRLHLQSFKISASVYGITIALSSLQEYEKFNEKHILKSVQNLIPGIIPVPNSYIACKYDSTFLYYMEIKKIRSSGFFKFEKQKLQKELLHELLNSIESTCQSLFLPGNDEALFKNIRHLSKELKYVHDLPQVMITFVEYFQETLKFLVIVLRLIKPSTPSFISLSNQLPSLVHFSLEKIFYVERLRKKYPKEAAIFTLEVNSSLFSRNGHAVNLRAARLYIVKAIESMLGPFRDYNGGLLNKENEQLLAIKRALEEQDCSFSYLEDLFYGIKPMEMRALLSKQTGIELAALFQKMLDTPLNATEKYARASFHSHEVHLEVIKSADKNWKASLPSRIMAYSSQIGCSVLEREGYFYFCFFLQYPGDENNVLCEALGQELAKQPLLLSYPRKTLLYLNFQSGDPLSLNPRLAADMPCHILSNLLFEGLTRMGRNGKIQLAAAEKVEISPCGLFYTFCLRQSWWSNGEEVTAYHFEKAWKKALIVNLTGYPYPDFFFLIKNVQKARDKAISLDQVGIEAKDAKTLCVTLESPSPYFLDLLSTPPFFPMLGESEEPSDFNGPFTVAEWKRNANLHLSQNPFYHNAQQIKIGGIKISMVRDPYLAYEMFQNGELDFIGDPISPLPPEILKQPEVVNNVIYKKISRIYWIHCNLRVFPLNNMHLRRALSLALNRKQITERVLLHQIPQISPLPCKYAHFQGSGEHDPDLARFYFEKALQEIGCTHSSFPNIMFTHSDLSFEKPLFEELKTQWQEVLGINVISQHLRWNEFSASIEKGNFQLCGLFRRDFFNNALFYLSFFKSSPTNPHSLHNEEYAQLLEQFQKEEGKEEILKKIESLLIEHTPVIPLVNQKFLALIAKHVKGVAWDENGCLDLKEAWIEEKDI